MCLRSTSMWILLLGFTSGLVASSWASSTQEVKVRGCSFAGVFHIQGNDRYTLSFDEAKKLCKTLGATLASATQMATAYNKSMESCRNGWISDGNIAILRHTSNSVCAGGQIGIVIFNSTGPKHDAYCYDEQDLSDINCNFTIGPNFTSLDNGPAPSNTAEVPSDTPTAEDTSSTTKLPLAFSEVTTVSEEKNPFPTSSEAQDKSGAVVFGDQSTGPLSTAMVTAVSAIQDDSLVTLSPSGTLPEKKIESTEVNNTSMRSLDNTGSGMGEPAQTITEEPNNEITQGTSPHHDKGRKAPRETEQTTDNGIPPTIMSGKTGADSSSEKTTKSGHSDWLVILCALLAVAVILLVCAAVVTRKRWCGKRKTLMITSKSSSEGNGTAASAASAQAQERQQEMVMLMNKEKIQENGNTEEFTVITLEESPEKNEQA